MMMAGALLLCVSGVMISCNSQQNQTDTSVADSTDVKAQEEVAVPDEPQEETVSPADEPEEEASQLTYANMAGIYDSYNEKGNSESRIRLNEDGTATWNMIGSLHLTGYTYTISGNTICMKVKGVDSEEECYDYDPDTRTLQNEQGAVYYRQVVN